MKRVGFVINSRVPEWAAVRRGMRPWAMLTGWNDAGSPMSFMRFGWVAEALRACGCDLRYELYRPGQRYEAVVFLKSMGPRCMRLAEELRAAGTRVVFEANVDYYTQFAGTARIEEMAPTEDQREAARAITNFADAVIASSRHLAGICEAINPVTVWVPDNVNLRMVPGRTQVAPVVDGKLQLWWSGMAAKAFEFLAIGGALRELREKVHLHLVTDALGPAMARWAPAVREEVDGLLARVPHTVHRFRGVPDLLRLYARGGVVISPRFLDTPYNLSHTEWKISLGMACGLPAVASPVPSYQDFAVLSGEPVVALCETEDEWVGVLEELLERPDEIAVRGQAAARVVADHYSSGMVALRHAEIVADVIGCY